METLLKNQSETMRTEVETYLIEETSNLIYDNEQLSKWNEHVKCLGLEGQKQLSTNEKSPIPFMHMKQSIVNVFETLCPMKVNVLKYDITPIPIEVLDLVALSQRENYFDTIQIWYDDKDPDPACVGISYTDYLVINSNGEKQSYSTYPKEEAQKRADEIGGTIEQSTWRGKSYLIGRWADVKRPIEELKEIAKKRFIEERVNRAKENIKNAEREIEDAEIEANKAFN